MKPTPTQRRLLERIATGPKLKVAIHGSGHSMAPRRCLEAGWIRLDHDPHVKDQFGYPASAYFITDEGLAALKT